MRSPLHGHQLPTRPETWRRTLRPAVSGLPAHLPWSHRGVKPGPGGAESPPRNLYGETARVGPLASKRSRAPWMS